MRPEDIKYDHRQDETDNLQKSVNPDGEYMKDHNLCRVCHGKIAVCDRSDCPQK